MALDLDFSLVYSDERAEFCQQFLTNIKHPLSQSDLDTISNYILWGKDRSTGRTGCQSGLAPSHWANADSGATCASLDELLENPAFDQASLSPIDSAKYCVHDEKFSREEALRDAPASFLPALKSLWAQIDELDMAICQWELAHGSRQKPPRDWLARKFSADQLTEICERVEKWSQATYLKKRRELRELRTEQLVLRDSWQPTLMSERSGAAIIPEWRNTSLEGDLVVLPLGVSWAPQLASQPGAWPLFRGLRELGKNCHLLDEQQKKWASDFWHGQTEKISGNVLAFDFRDEEQLVKLVEARRESDPLFKKLVKDPVKGWDVGSEWAGRWSIGCAPAGKNSERKDWNNARIFRYDDNVAGNCVGDCNSNLDSGELLANTASASNCGNCNGSDNDQINWEAADRKISGLADDQKSLAALFDTLDFYAAEADLNEAQQQIFYFKEQRIGNEAIAATINARFGKNYTVNYISTIFRQKIIPRIAAAAKRHEAIVSNIWFEEEFKTCIKCGQTLLKDDYYFTHQARSKDGYSPRCKICERRK